MRTPDAPSPNNVTSLINDALNRLGSLVDHSGKIAGYLRQAEQGNTQCGAKPTAEPTLVEKLHGVHELITTLEGNIGYIGATIG